MRLSLSEIASLAEVREEEPPVERSFLKRLWQHSALRYLLVGGVAFLFDAGLLGLFHVVFGWPTWIAAGTAFLVSFVVTYTLQRMFAFQSDIAHGKALVRYVILVAFNTVATMFLVQLLAVTVVGWFGAKVIATALTTIWNYFVYRLLVFPPAALGPDK